LKFSGLLDGFRNIRALVVGDLMLDEYVFGRATRISPEAPVMVVRHQRTARVPGGAANVARNLLALGAETRTVGVAGCDEAGRLLEESLFEHGLKGVALVRDETRATTRKTRVLADHTHQVLRIDQEDDLLVSEDVQDRLISAALSALNDSDVVVLSDYLKGALTERVSQTIIEQAAKRHTPVVVNPKPRTLDYYRGAALISLNRAEASEAAGMYKMVSDADALALAGKLKTDTAADAVLITLGESGMAASGTEDVFVDSPKVEVYDTAGAGDTVIATVALGIATVGFSREVFELAAHTAGRVVRHVGVATPSAEDLDHIRSL
jgi:rfaE bifunctional protein kinase chain/domain